MEMQIDFRLLVIIKSCVYSNIRYSRYRIDVKVYAF